MNKVFIFYYCDEHKSRNKMRIHKVYADTEKGRRALAECIISESQNGDIEVEDSPELIRHTCVYGSPIYLNSAITYGFIESEDVEE